MKEEEKEVLDKTDAQFLAELKAKMNGEEVKTDSKEEQKQSTKVVKDTKLYDELQISPDATQN